MRNFYLTIIGLFIIQASQAQQLPGLEAGFSDNVLKTNASGQASSVISPKAGWYFSLNYQIALSHVLRLAAAASYIQKNYQITRTDSLAGAYSAFINSYLQVPLVVRLSFGKKLHYCFGAGLFGAYWLTGSEEGKIPDIFSDRTDYGSNSHVFSLVSYKRNKTFNKQTDNRIEYGYAGSVNISFDLVPKMEVYTSLGYFYSISDQQKRYSVGEIPRYNQTFTVAFGAAFHVD